MAIPIYQRSGSGSGYETFYIPAYNIAMSGGHLSGAVIHDVMEVRYHDSADAIDLFELTINNWDATTRSCKYIGKGTKSANEKLFLPGQQLQIYMGYRQPGAGNNPRQLNLMMKGQITALEPDFPSGSPPTIRVRGLNILHSFQKKQYTYLWSNKRDSEIAKELGQKASGDKPGLGIEVRIDQNALAKEPIEPVVFMDSMYEILFLQERARLHGYTFYLVEEENGKPVTPYLYFGPSDRDTHPPYKLEWGKSLMDFHPTFNITKQVSQVTVRGWDRETQKEIVSTANWGDVGARLNMDLKSFLPAQALEGRDAVVLDRPVYTTEQAKAMARDLLLRNLKEMLTASGSTVGLPELRAGRMAQIMGLGQHFDGAYFITETTHTIGDGGYHTNFNVRREQDVRQRNKHE